MRCINACYKSISITNETLVLLVMVVYQLTSMNEKKAQNILQERNYGYFYIFYILMWLFRKRIYSKKKWTKHTIWKENTTIFEKLFLTPVLFSYLSLWMILIDDLGFIGRKIKLSEQKSSERRFRKVQFWIHRPYNQTFTHLSWPLGWGVAR